MILENKTSHTLTDHSINRIEGMLLGVGDTEQEAILGFLDMARSTKSKSEENVKILEQLIIDAENLLKEFN